jgi:hypothetical protein
MGIPAYYPYRSAEARDTYLSFCDVSAGQWPVVSESRVVSTSYGRTFVRVSGPGGGQPLVLLPGMASSSLFWAPNIEAWSVQYRTYAVDTIGEVGRSVCTKSMDGSARSQESLNVDVTSQNHRYRYELEGGHSCPQPAFSRLGRLKGGCGQDWPPSKQLPVESSGWRESQTRSHHGSRGDRAARF